MEPAPQVTVRAQPPVLALLMSSADGRVAGDRDGIRRDPVSLILMMSLLVFTTSVPAAEKFEVALLPAAVLPKAVMPVAA